MYISYTLSVCFVYFPLFMLIVLWTLNIICLSYTLYTTGERYHFKWRYTCFVRCWWLTSKKRADKIIECFGRCSACVLLFSKMNVGDCDVGWKLVVNTKRGYRRRCTRESTLVHWHTKTSNRLFYTKDPIFQ